MYPILPEEYKGIPVEDYGDRIIVPGFVDLHVHAPQYAFRGLGMDMELLDWSRQILFQRSQSIKTQFMLKKLIRCL